MHHTLLSEVHVLRCQRDPAGLAQAALSFLGHRCSILVIQTPCNPPLTLIPRGVFLKCCSSKCLLPQDEQCLEDISESVTGWPHPAVSFLPPHGPVGFPRHDELVPAAAMPFLSFLYSYLALKTQPRRSQVLPSLCLLLSPS